MPLRTGSPVQSISGLERSWRNPWIKHLNMSALRIATFAAFVGMTQGFAYYSGSIPNGNQVPNPCMAGEMWRGVGHIAETGGGARNQFGIDFQANNRDWQSVCRMDSDGDGLTNGQELGDPDCVWSGGIPSRTTGLSHPGFCDPSDSTRCLQSANKAPCDGLTFDCPAINEPGVESRVLQFPRTTVPNKDTNYWCMTFDLDQSRDYHMIATKAEIDNANVMHHIILYGCRDGAQSMPSPTSCGMSSEQCQDVIGLWTVGIAGECMYKEAGFRVGKTGYKRLLLEFHWNNPELRSDYTDASGMTIYYTPNLRTHDAGVFWTGQNYLEIPPNRDRVVFESTCPSECTSRMFKESIFFTQGINHMHYKGIAQTVEKISNGERMYITNEQNYSYDSPMKYEYKQPIEIRPGDALKTTCIFKSIGSKKTIFFGPATSDEMCFGIFTYYPKEGTTNNRCVSWKNFQSCKLVDGYYGNCPFNDFLNTSVPETEMLVDKVLENCNSFGGCRDECPAAIEEAERHPCLQGDNMIWALEVSARSIDVKLVRFAGAMTSCRKDGGTGWPMTAGATTAITSVVSLVVAGVIFRIFQ